METVASFRVVLVGPLRTGKTTFLHRCLTGDLLLDPQLHPHKQDLPLPFWTTCGRIRAVVDEKHTFSAFDCGIIMVDGSSRGAGAASVRPWKRRLSELRGGVCPPFILLLGAKSDLGCAFDLSSGADMIRFQDSRDVKTRRAALFVAAHFPLPFRDLRRVVAKIVWQTRFESVWNPASPDVANVQWLFVSSKNSHNLDEAFEIVAQQALFHPDLQIVEYISVLPVEITPEMRILWEEELHRAAHGPLPDDDDM